MDWITGIQKAIDYIEDNIMEELDYEKIAAESFGCPLRKKHKTTEPPISVRKWVVASFIGAGESDRGRWGSRSLLRQRFRIPLLLP